MFQGLSERRRDNNEHKIAALPLRGVVVSNISHLDVGRERLINALDEAMVMIIKSRWLLKRSKIDDPNPAILPPGNCYHQADVETSGWTIRVSMDGLSRARIKNFIENKSF